ncbi:uncharacterized protein LOC131989998 [Centropristis striata]|uniref:uncharacterized protein LOC131989998 n=1 Tax=Centropristis striata TaxID=184440 RepID=UPI0027E1B337|nr:uncharacterized protein LOC131989998 [Centropristis striata]
MALFILMFLLSAAAAEEIFNQTVSPGDNVNLSCEAGNGFIRAVEWTRPDLKKGEYVLFYSDGHSIPTEQHESFRDRVQLVDRQPQDRDVSLILKNVTNNDAGTYECRVSLGASRQKKRAIKGKLFQKIHLIVKDRDSSDGIPEGGNFSRVHLGLGLGGAAGVVLLVSCIAGFLFWKHKRPEAENSTPPAASPDPAGVELINMSPSSLQPAADSPPV